jgi:hypothetical protein
MAGNQLHSDTISQHLLRALRVFIVPVVFHKYDDRNKGTLRTRRRHKAYEGGEAYISAEHRFNKDCFSLFVV